MSAPLVSVVIPAYNAEKWIGECIQSVLMQDYPNLELIVIDDCSKDQTLSEINRNLLESPIKFMIISNEENSGEYATTEKGFALAKGRYIARLSSDDCWVSKDHITSQIKVMEKTGADFCYNRYNSVGETPVNSREYHTYLFPLKYRNAHECIFGRFDNWILKHPRFTLAIHMKRNPINSSALMFRAASYQSARISTKLRTSWDTVILSRMYLKKMIGISIPKIGAFYRIHPSQGSYSPIYMEELKEIYRELSKNVLQGEYPFWLKVYMRLLWT